MTVPSTLPRSTLDYEIKKNAIGLVAVSSRPDWASTFKRFLTGKLHSADTELMITRVLDVISFAKVKDAQALYETLAVVWNGHTALLVRVDGEPACVTGWNPNVDIWSAAVDGEQRDMLLKLVTRQPIVVPGRWFDDMKMVAGPTAIAFEVPVARSVAETLATEASRLIGTSDWLSRHPENASFRYCFKYSENEGDEPDEVEFDANCAVAAVEALVTVMSRPGVLDASTSGKCAAQGLSILSTYQEEGDFSQGKVMQTLPRWQEQIDGVLDQIKIEEQLFSRN